MSKKGRNVDLIKKRDDKLYERFLYHYDVCKIRLDEVLRILSEEEFFLSEQRIWTIIKGYQGVPRAELMDRIKKPKVRAVRGVPTSLKVVSEYDYSLFPASSAR